MTSLFSWPIRPKIIHQCNVVATTQFNTHDYPKLQPFWLVISVWAARAPKEKEGKERLPRPTTGLHCLSRAMPVPGLDHAAGGVSRVGSWVPPSTPRAHQVVRVLGGDCGWHRRRQSLASIWGCGQRVRGFGHRSGIASCGFQPCGKRKPHGGRWFRCSMRLPCHWRAR